MHSTRKINRSEYPIRYKGYWIHKNPLTGQMWIEKDSCFIGYCSNRDRAETIINELVTQ